MNMPASVVVHLQIRFYLHFPCTLIKRLLQDETLLKKQLLGRSHHPLNLILTTLMLMWVHHQHVKHMTDTLGSKHQCISWVTLIQLDGLFARSKLTVWMSPYVAELSCLAATFQSSWDFTRLLWLILKSHYIDGHASIILIRWPVLPGHLYVPCVPLEDIY